MTTRRLKAWMIMALVSVLPLLQACQTPPGRYYDVATTTNGIRTGQRPEPPGSTFQFYMHEDLPEDACADLAAAPDGVLQFLAYLHEASADNWILSIRTGFGVNTWSTTLSEIAVPEINQFSPCVPLRIKHLRDGQYAIVWVVEGALHSALYDSTKPPSQDLVLNDVLPAPSFDEVDARAISIVYFDDRPWLVFARQFRNQINLKRGTLSENGIRFDTSNTFASHSYMTMSDAVVHGDAIYVATADNDAVYLHRKARTSGTFVEEASCPGSDAIANKLLYVDANGDMRVLLRRAITFENFLQNFSDCSTVSFAIPAVSGHITYSPL